MRRGFRGGSGSEEMHPWPFHRFIQGTCAHRRPFDVREVCHFGQWPPPVSAEHLTMHGHTMRLTSLGNGGNTTIRQTRISPGSQTMGRDYAYLYPLFPAGSSDATRLVFARGVPDVCCAEARPRRDRRDVGQPARYPTTRIPNYPTSVVFRRIPPDSY